MPRGPEHRLLAGGRGVLYKRTRAGVHASPFDVKGHGLMLRSHWKRMGESDGMVEFQFTGAGGTASIYYPPHLIQVSYS